MNELPLLFLERLKKILPNGQFESAVKSLFNHNRFLSIRINSLKAEKEAAINTLLDNHIEFKEVPWYEEALILLNVSKRELQNTNLVAKGYIYIQGLSSMLPSLVLSPRPGEEILDMCAAPGSKTTQMASLMHNQGRIVSLENIKDRYYKLKAVIRELGATIVGCQLIDARKFHPHQLFDKALVDVPCSSEGRFKTFNQKTCAYWSLRKIKEMVRKQKGILLNACRLVKPQGTVVYSTCTFAPEENEGVINWVLKKMEGAVKIEPIKLADIKTYPALSQWQGKTFDAQIQNCLRILPDEAMEGFFIAKLVKIF